ncbi:MAG: response regulator transcription factor [Thermodesulfobacteriota bacterium]
MTSRTRVLLVEDHAILRDGLASIFDEHPEFQVVAEAEDGEAALRQCQRLAPDLVLLDLSLPKKDGMAVLAAIKRSWPATRVMVLTMHREPQLVAAILDLGADGYCLKDAGTGALLAGMRRVCRGERYVSPELDGGGEEPVPPKSREAGAVPLTAREREILRLVAEGRTNPQIAEALYISLRTVDNHCTNIRSKLGLHSKQEITAYAFRAGLVG